VTTRARDQLADVRAFGRYARRLRRFLAEPMSEAAARETIADTLARREQRFLDVLDAGVFGRPQSPYRRLLAHAGAERGDIALMLRRDGLEATLGALLDAGVTLSIAEAKGLTPVRRGMLELRVRPRDLQNRLAAQDIAATTGGSRSSGTAFWVDLRDTVESSAYAALTRSAFGLEQADAVLWYPAPPGIAGLRRALWWSKAGLPLRSWFAQSVPGRRPRDLRRAAFLGWTVRASRRAGRPIPRPRFTPATEARHVAEALAVGGPTLLLATPTSAVRVCDAAAEAGIDLAGTFFALAGEPYTAAKARRIAAAGGLAESGYYVSEVGGPVAVGCASPHSVDTGHVAAGRIAVVQRERILPGGARVAALHLTTLSQFAPQIALNLEVGDYAVSEPATCGCLFARAGLVQTLHGIRSYEKLTTEGMHFLGPRLVELLEEALPERFGGSPTDYQLVEQEDSSGHSTLTLVVAPRVGELDERAVVRSALDVLGSGGPAEAMMASLWRAGGTLTVSRREPAVTPAGKVLPLHVAR
jgi:hypothetical protein